MSCSWVRDRSPLAVPSLSSLAGQRTLRPSNLSHRPLGGGGGVSAGMAARIANTGGGGSGGGGEGGIVNNFKSLLEAAKNLPSGVAGLAKETGESILGFGELGYDAITGNTDHWSDDYGTNLEHYFPVLESFRESYANTGRNLSNPGRYIDAWNEGQGLTTLVEDVGNLALPTMVAGKAASAAGATTTGARLQNIARLGDQFGSAPAKIWTEPLRGANALTRRLTGTPISEMASSSLNRYVSREGAGAMSRGIANAIDPEARAARRFLSDSGTRIAEAQAVPLEEMVLRFPKADPDLLTAASASRRGLYEWLGDRKDLPAELFDRFIEGTFGEGLSPAAARLAIDAAEGRLDVDAQATFDAARQVADEIQAARNDTTFARPGETPDEFIARTGQTEGPLNPEQLGNVPMQRVLDADRKLVRDRGTIRRLNEKVLPELEERAVRLRAQASARRALTRPVVEPPTQKQMLSRGRQQGRTQARLTQARSNVDRLRRELAKAIDDFTLADEADAANLTALADRLERTVDAYNSALDNYNSAVRQLEVASATRPTSATVGGLNRRISNLVNDLQSAEDLGRPTESLRSALAEARREYELSRNAVGGATDAPVRVASDQRLGRARAELAAAKRDTNAAERSLDTAASRSGATPRRLVSALDAAQRRLDEAQASVVSLERELDAQMGFNAGGRTPSLRSTFGEGEVTGRFDQRARIAEANLRKAQRRIENLNARIAKRTAEAHLPHRRRHPEPLASGGRRVRSGLSRSPRDGKRTRRSVSSLAARVDGGRGPPHHRGA